MEHSAILLTCIIKAMIGLEKTICGLFESGRFTLVLHVLTTYVTSVFLYGPDAGSFSKTLVLITFAGSLDADQGV